MTGLTIQAIFSLDHQYSRRIAADAASGMTTELERTDLNAIGMSLAFRAQRSLPPLQKFAHRGIAFEPDCLFIGLVSGV
jgi:hypothetical protein